MSAEARKNCRTQGKYNDKNLQYEDRKPRKSLEKRLKESPTEKETQEKKFLKRKSDGTKEGTSFNSENNESFVEYQENSDYSFAKLEERKKPIEIKKPGKMVLSNTENGESSVLYEPDFYTDDEACELFDFLRESTEWLDKSIVIHGIEYPQPRLVAWYGPLPYSYSGTTLEPAEMPDCVLGIKRRVEDYLKGNNIDVELNSVLLNLYRNNKDSVSWHSDDEFTMGVCPTIASISLGETRRFEMRPKISRYCEDEQEKKRDEYFAHLHNGSLIIMDGCMQEDWQHRVPKEYHDRRARINLTFRTVYEFKKGSPYAASRVNNYKPVDREMPKNSGRNKIDLDEENFPPLSFVSNNVNSKPAHKAHEKAESFETKFTVKTNKISEKEAEINYPNYETSSEINDQINNSEEIWTVETPPSNKTTSRFIDRIKAQDEEWGIKTPFGAKAVFETKDDVCEHVEKWEDVTSSEINDRINNSEELWVVETPPSNKTTSRFSDRIKAQDEEWGIKTPFGTKAAFETKDDVREYVEEREDETPPYQRPSTKSNGTANESKDLTIESLSNNRDYPETVTEVRKSENTAVKHTFSSKVPPHTNNNINTSEEEWNLTSPIKNNNSHSEFGEINKSHYNCYEESASISEPTPPESNNKSSKNWYEESYNSQILSESDETHQLHEERREESYDNQQQTSLKSNKIYESNEGYFDKPFHRQTPSESNESNFEKPHHRRTPSEYNKNYHSNESYFEKPHYRRTPSECNKSQENKNFKSSFTRPHRFQSDETYKYQEERAAKPFDRRNAKRYPRYNERGSTEPFYNKNISRREKNFQSDEGKSFESHSIESNTISNENIDDYEPRSRNQNSNSRERRNESSNFAERSIRIFFSDIKNEPKIGKGWKPNVKAEEFIPGKIKRLPSEIKTRPSKVNNSTFGHFPLNDLLNYDVDRMPSDDLKNYANALKLRVLNQISAFEPSDKEELEVLCEITDGCQTDRNQKIICSRICALVNKTVPCAQWNPKVNPTVSRYHQQASYGNENHYEDRR